MANLQKNVTRLRDLLSLKSVGHAGSFHLPREIFSASPCRLILAGEKFSSWARKYFDHSEDAIHKQVKDAALHRFGTSRYLGRHERIEDLSSCASPKCQRS